MVSKHINYIHHLKIQKPARQQHAGAIQQGEGQAAVGLRHDPGAGEVHAPHGGWHDLQVWSQGDQGMSVIESLDYLINN